MSPSSKYFLVDCFFILLCSFLAVFSKSHHIYLLLAGLDVLCCFVSDGLGGLSCCVFVFAGWVVLAWIHTKYIYSDIFIMTCLTFKTFIPLLSSCLLGFVPFGQEHPFQGSAAAVVINKTFIAQFEFLANDDIRDPNKLYCRILLIYLKYRCNQNVFVLLCLYFISIILHIANVCFPHSKLLMALVYHLLIMQVKI